MGKQKDNGSEKKKRGKHNRTSKPDGLSVRSSHISRSEDLNLPLPLKEKSNQGLEITTAAASIPDVTTTNVDTAIDAFGTEEWAADEMEAEENNEEQNKDVEGEAFSAVSGDEDDAALQEVVPQPMINETTAAAWKAVLEHQKTGFSFFDNLFMQGYVVDSLEVLSTGPREKEEHFVVAEEDILHSKTEHGRVVYKTKNVYTGSFDDWFPQGIGQYTWVDGSIYEGDFVEGLQNGQGTMTWSDGTVYQGEFSNGLVHGSGCLHWPDGSIYKGDFQNGDRVPGLSTYYTPDGVIYDGDWKDGVPHGEGTVWYDASNKDVDFYEGGWVDGKYEGIGVRQYSNGDRYMGHWEKGERSGCGTMIWLEDRQIYRGEWVRGVPHGKGIHTWYMEWGDPQGRIPRGKHVYEGGWEDGKRHGAGRITYPCGTAFQGEWNRGRATGETLWKRSQKCGLKVLM